MKIIACYSNKGGVGKTAVAVNLACTLAAYGKRVLLCDLDPQGASSFYFRVKPSKKLKDAAFFKDVEKFANAIRGSDYENLDILPANMDFREFDIFLANMRNGRSRLAKALKPMKGDYDVVVLDCPPSISMLAENIFRAADLVLVPVIPTTLSHRSFEQLIDFFKENDLQADKVVGFFSMVQSVKTLHRDTIDAVSAGHGKRMLDTCIPFSSDIERMGLHRAPVVATAPQSPGAKAYRALATEVEARL